MLTFSDSDDPKRLAELGLLNENDLGRTCVHYQEPNIQLDNIHDKNLVDSLQKQLPGNPLLNGFATWNVKLASTINALPPCLHYNGYSRKLTESHNLAKYSSIDQILSAGNFVMSANKSN
jgi:hypothetical protein